MYHVILFCTAFEVCNNCTTLVLVINGGGIQDIFGFNDNCFVDLVVSLNILPV